MASPVKDAKLRAQQIWPGAAVHSRNKGSIKHQHPTDPDRFILDTQVGGRGWHFGDGPFTEANEVDTAWVNAEPADAPWQKRMVLADYNAYAFREPTLQFDQGQLIEYRHPTSGEAVSFQPQQLQWTNDLGQISPVADPQPVSATIDDDTLTWIDAYGSGIDFQWEAQTARLMKYVNIANLQAITQLITDEDDPYFGQYTPPEYIRDGGNPVLRVELLFQKSANTEIWVDGVLWDEKSNNPQETLDNVEFRLAGETLWYFKAPKAWDNTADGTISPTMRLRSSAQNLFVEILTPWTWLEAATYPLTIDVTIDEQVGADLDDIRERDPPDADSISDIGHVLTTGDWQWNWSGLMFRAVAVPNAVTIDVAYLTVFLRTQGEDPDLTMAMEDVDDAATFTESYPDVSARPLTATVSWDDTGLPENAFTDSPSIVVPVQQVVDRGGWATGQDMVCIMEADDASCDLHIDQHDNSPSNAAKLHIEYTVAGGGVNVDIPVGTLAVSGQAPTVAVTGHIGIDIPVASLATTGLVPTIAVSVSVTIPVATLTTIGLIPTAVITANISIDIPVATLTAVGLIPTVVTPVNIDIPVVVLTIAGLVPIVGIGINITVPVAILTATGLVPIVATTAHIDIEVPAASLAIIGYIPNVQAGANIEIDIPLTALGLTLYAPIIVATAGVNIEVPVVALTAAGYMPVVEATASVDVIVPVALLTAMGYAPDIVGGTGAEITVPTGTLAMTGLVPIVMLLVFGDLINLESGITRSVNAASALTTEVNATSAFATKIDRESSI